MAIRAHRPTVMASRHAVSAGHYLAAQAGMRILDAGGNAIDAGVAAGLALGVVESEYVSISGVAPILVYIAETCELMTIDGLGTWPRAASCAYFREHHGGTLPVGILRTVVPAAMDAWLTALERYGTVSFADAARDAIALARDGFPMYATMREIVESSRPTFENWPASAAVFLPGGRIPEVGERFVQADLGRTLQFLADEERAAAVRGDRKAGLAAVRHAFYRGDIAARMVKHQRENGGLLSAEDLANYRVTLEPPKRVRFGDAEVYGCGPWCQGPMMLQALAILDGAGLGRYRHNEPDYLHQIAEALNLAAADREAYYGDPKHVDVPIERLLSPEYAALRRALIDPVRAIPGLAPAGHALDGALRRAAPAAVAPRGPVLDTSYVAVVDRHGNAFSATPSDGSLMAPIVPGLGFAPSARGYQAWLDPGHPSSVAPMKRPRLTPNPALAIKPGEYVMPFGSPGHDVQTQVMLQVFLNMAVFGMEPQEAVEAPRISTLSFPSSAFPHASLPNRLFVERSIAPETLARLRALGHDAEWWPEAGPEYLQALNAVCLVRHDLETDIKLAAADPRRPAYALGW